VLIYGKILPVLGTPNHSTKNPQKTTQQNQPQKPNHSNKNPQPTTNKLQTNHQQKRAGGNI
jgi:hypothetical protein